MIRVIFLVISSIIFKFSSSNPLLFVDLSHTIHANIPFFPSQTRFNFTQRVVKAPDSVNSFFYSTNAFVTGEHMGTHIDAPYHFFENGWKVDEIPIKNLVSVNARIIDVSKQCQETKNYLITVDDVKKKDFIVPEIDENTGEKFLFVLIFYTGWTKYWPDQLTYAGGESELEFPGLSDQLATYLVDTYGDQLVGIGIDTLSTDFGQSKTYPVHQILSKHNKYGLENLALIDPLLENVNDNFFSLDIFPMKIGNGTGAPCRIIARIDIRYRTNRNWFDVLVVFFLIFLLTFIIKVVYDFKYNPNKDF